MNLKGSKTEQNLKDAFAGESQANRRYLYFAGKADVAPAHGDPTSERISELSGKILDLIAAEPAYYQDIAARFSGYDFQTVARALGKLHAEQKLWQDTRGRLCVRGSGYAAKPPSAG